MQVAVSVVSVLAVGGAMAGVIWFVWRQTGAPTRPATGTPVVDPVGGPLGSTALAMGAHLAAPGACSGADPIAADCPDHGAP